MADVPAPGKTQTPAETDRRSGLMQADSVYQAMQRLTDLSRVRMHMATKYTILMFAIFLVFLWIVNNRVIMFGFSDFTLLTRVRDMLFGVMAGLFSLTIWYGTSVWFGNIFLRIFLRIFSLLFFLAVIAALYLPSFQV